MNEVEPINYMGTYYSGGDDHRCLEIKTPDTGCDSCQEVEKNDNPVEFYSPRNKDERQPAQDEKECPERWKKIVESAGCLGEFFYKIAPVETVVADLSPVLAKERPAMMEHLNTGIIDNLLFCLMS